jgi:hypothetical protein
MKIHLTESIFNRLLLTEATTEEIYQKYYTDIPYQTYCRILLLDPTYNNGRMGRYTKWLLNIYRKGTFKEGDFNEAIQLLPIYDRYKNVVPVKDIMTLNSMGELYSVVEPYMAGDKATSKSDAARKIKGGAEKVYEDNQWLIIIPHTMEAAILYGKNTQWCTAAEKSMNMFDYYNNQGSLYINIDKVNNRKYQFHFESNSFMNEEDDPIFDMDDGASLPSPNISIADVMGMPPGAKNYYKQLCEQGVENAAVIISSPVEFLDKLIKEKINTSRYGMDIVDDEPAKPGEIGSTRILGWATFVKYRSSHVIECQITNKWFRECSRFTELDKPIMCKTGMSNKVASVAVNNDDCCMIVDGNGKFAFDKIFHFLPYIASNGFAIAETSPNECNIFDLNNNCIPVFSTPFSKIYGGGFGEEGGEALLIAERKDKNGIETYYINAHGLEFNYDTFYNNSIKNYNDKIMNLFNTIRKNDFLHYNDRGQYAAHCVTDIASEMVNEIPLDGLDIETKKDLLGHALYRTERRLYSHIRNYLPSLPSQMPL